MSDSFGDALVEMGESVASKADFVKFLDLLVQNHQDHPDEWQNATMDEFLAAIRGFTESMDGYYHNIGAHVNVQNPTWRVFADILLAGRVYE